MRPLPTLAGFLAFALLAVPSSAAVGKSKGGGAAKSELVRAELLANVDAVAPGKPVTLGVKLTMKSHWHTYWANPGESGQATEIKLSGPAGFEFGAVQWPLPSKLAAPGGFSYGYEDEVLLMVPTVAPKDLTPGADVTLAADVSWLSCNETCIQGGAKLTITLPTKAEAKPANAELFAAWRDKLPAATAAAVVEAVDQASAADGSPEAALTVKWKAVPKKVEFYPVATRAVAVEDVAVTTDGKATKIQFKPTVYKAQDVTGGKIDGVLVYEDEAGRRRGVTVPVSVIKLKLK